MGEAQVRPPKNKLQKNKSRGTCTNECKHPHAPNTPLSLKPTTPTPSKEKPLLYTTNTIISGNGNSSGLAVEKREISKSRFNIQLSLEEKCGKTNILSVEFIHSRTIYSSVLYFILSSLPLSMFIGVRPICLPCQSSVMFVNLVVFFIHIDPLVHHVLLTSCSHAIVCKRGWCLCLQVALPLPPHPHSPLLSQRQSFDSKMFQSLYHFYFFCSSLFFSSNHVSAKFSRYPLHDMGIVDLLKSFTMTSIIMMLIVLQ